MDLGLHAPPLDQYADELQGKWIALVPAENDRHLELAELKKQRDELLAALENTHNALKRFWPEGHVDAIAAIASVKGGAA